MTQVRWSSVYSSGEEGEEGGREGTNHCHTSPWWAGYLEAADGVKEIFKGIERVLFRHRPAFNLRVEVRRGVPPLQEGREGGKEGGREGGREVLLGLGGGYLCLALNRRH